MNKLQFDLLEIYNNLVEFSKRTVVSKNPVPIKVWFDKNGVESPLVFEQQGTVVRLRLPIYYCLGLEDLTKPTYLLPEDYNTLMTTLKDIIYDKKILDDRTILSPENYGFDLYAINPSQFYKGLEIFGSIRFVSGKSWLFKFITKRKYKL